MAWLHKRRLGRLSTLSSAAGTLVAYQTDAGKADLQAVSAGKGVFWSGGGGGAGLPPLTLFFKCLLSVLLKLGRGLADCVAPCMSRSAARSDHCLWSMLQVLSDFFRLPLNLFFGAPLSQCPVESSPNMTILGRRWSSIRET